MKRVLFSIPILHPLSWTLRLSIPVKLLHSLFSHLLLWRKILLSKQKLYRLVGSYYIISLNFYSIVSAIVSVFLWFLGTAMYIICHYNVH